MAWRNLIVGHLRIISTKLFENQPNTFWVDFLSFHYSHIRENSPAPWQIFFLNNQHGLKESDSRSLKEQFYWIIWKSAGHFRRRVFTLAILGKIAPVTWQLWFSTIQHGLKEYDTGSSKEQFLKIIWKSANQFWKKKKLKYFLFRCLGNQNSAWIPNIWRNSGEVTKRMLSVKFYLNWPTGYWGEDVDTRQTSPQKGDHNNSPWALRAQMAKNSYKGFATDESNNIFKRARVRSTA